MSFLDFTDTLESSHFKGLVLKNESLASHSTMHVGGPAKLFIEPHTEESLIIAIRTASESNLDFFILGGGSNTIFPDEGLDLVISTRKINTIEGDVSPHAPAKASAPLSAGSDAARSEGTSVAQYACLTVSAGASWGAVITYCKKHNLGGFEPFTGLSGTAGGALYMNATCFGLTTCDNLVSVKYLDLEDNKIKTYKKNASDWGYKRSPFQNNLCSSEKYVDKIILSATFKVAQGFDQTKSDEVKAKRIAMGHFKAPSAGSAFKNKPDEGIIAGKIIDECGLKGFAIGGAQIAPWHGNFIINPDHKATCSDIKALVEHVQKVVVEKTGIQLEPEILFV